MDALPDEIPTDLYAYQLSSEEDRAAFAALQLPLGADQSPGDPHAPGSIVPLVAEHGHQDTEQDSGRMRQPAADQDGPAAVNEPAIAPPPPPPPPIDGVPAAGMGAMPHLLHRCLCLVARHSTSLRVSLFILTGSGTCRIQMHVCCRQLCRHSSWP